MGATEERRRELPFDQTGRGPSVGDVLDLMEEEGIPYTARLDYAGCGSHAVELVWTPSEPKACTPVPCPPFEVAEITVVPDWARGSEQ